MPESLVVVVLVVLAVALILVVLVLIVLLVVLILAVFGVLRAVGTIVVLVVVHTSSFPLPSGSSDHRGSILCLLSVTGSSMSKSHKNYALKMLVLWYYLGIDFWGSKEYNF